MSLRSEGGQTTRKRGAARLPRSASVRRVTVPPVQRHTPGPAILALKAEMDRLINEIGPFIADDGRMATLEFIGSGPKSKMSLFVRQYEQHLDVTIASGDVDLSKLAPPDAGKAQVTYYVRVNAETGTTDNWDTITGLNRGDIVIAYPATGDTITVRDASASSGDFQLAGATAFAMDSPLDRVALQRHNAANIVELYRADNS